MLPCSHKFRFSSTCPFGRIHKTIEGPEIRECGHTPMLVIKRFVVIAVLALGVQGCSNPVGTGYLDPYEEQNRGMHETNKAIDQALLGPTAQAYGDGIPQPVRRGVGNFASNLSLPSYFVNHVLQGDVESATRTFFRFAFNSTMGLGGLLDPASEMGLFEEDTDFGETLYVWGVPEGNYIELPLVGPSTERHAVGRVVDFFINPVGLVVDSPESYYLTATTLLSRVDERYEYSSTVDSILYESEDSYAAARRLYLDNRRFKLGVEVTEEEIDEIELLFLELYGE